MSAFLENDTCIWLYLYTVYGENIIAVYDRDNQDLNENCFTL